MRRAVRFEHPQPPRPAALDEFRAQPALADAGLTDHAATRPVPSSERCQRRLERGHLVAPAHEARQPARTRDVQARSMGAQALQLEYCCGLATPLTCTSPRSRSAKYPSTKRACTRDSRMLRLSASAPCVARGPPCGPARCSPCAGRRRSCRRRPRPSSCPCAKAKLSPCVARAVGIAAQRIPQVQRRITRALGMILVRDRRAEEGHDAVARVLVHRAFEAVHASVRIAKKRSRIECHSSGSSCRPTPSNPSRRRRAPSPACVRLPGRTSTAGSCRQGVSACKKGGSGLGGWGLGLDSDALTP